MVYFDTSYILKCYLNEPGAEKVRMIASKHADKFSSVWGKTEFISGIKRQTREGKIPPPIEKTIFKFFDDDEKSGVWKWFDCDQSFMEEFHDFLRHLPSSLHLRSGDALHLYTAKYHGFKAIYSHDRHLLNAASSFGLKALDVI